MRQFLFFIIFNFSVGSLIASNAIDSLLIVLENHMANRSLYDAEKQNRIDKIKELKLENDISAEQIFFLNSKLIKEYESFIFDSALFYLEKNLEISKAFVNQDLEISTKLSLAKLLATTGRYKDSEQILKSIKTNKVTNELKVDYYLGYQNVYSILNFYSQVKENKKIYEKLCAVYSDSLLNILNHNSETYLSIIETQFRDSRQMDACLNVNSKRLQMTQIGQKGYSMVTFERALDFELLGDFENYKKFLILSAISDIKLSVKDNASLASLASILYKEQELKKAYAYINFSYEDALFFNSRLRFTLISNILPIINDAYQLKSNKQKKALRLSLVLISILTIGLFITVLLISYQMKRLSKTKNELKEVNDRLRLLNTELNDVNSKLQESNKVKEHYIGNFLSICSNYIDKLDNYRKMVNKHLLNRQMTELFEKTKSIDFIDEETKEFYDNFDKTFLHIFPNFVEKMNSLLVENEHFELKSDEHLNTELRIFALIRLGIFDSNQIATLLRYSIRTIYNYRVKIKNKALVPRDDFEEYVLKIGAFSK